MFFIKDTVNKIMIGWSAKCGCSHIKKIYYYLTTDNIDSHIHTTKDYNRMGIIDDEYKILIFIRNPYERLVSGFLDKYKKDGSFINTWDSNVPLTFSNFVDELIKNDYKQINRHHFTPQLSESWHNKIINHKNLKVYDINNIDYNYIEKLYNKKIPKELLNFRGDHVNKKEIFDYGQDNKIYDLLQNDYENKRPLSKNFYNDDIKKKVFEFYKNDFEYFKSIEFDYDI